ncbi:protection of telomeres protein 1 isoform 2-T2 [Anomaloglossus baeobatrachus]|uniref:protection of telomeres protein 1 isoform X2 n=1 Tax=Anomaloglossus baeobatrachus TaxID=238106 RepID=UPI003F4F4A98
MEAYPAKAPPITCLSGHVSGENTVEKKRALSPADHVSVVKRRRMSGPAHRYTYTPLDQLEENKVANVYGAVTFFKLPYRSKGTDYCSIITIVDQSNVKLKCTFFSGNQDGLPKIYKIGDIVRFHRIKIQKFNNEFQGISSSGFSALVFEGTVDAPLVPRSSTERYSFTAEDQKTVELLRIWQLGLQQFSGSRRKLSDVQPGQYFDLICQLVAKAEVDKASYLLKVWDGTKYASLSWKVFVEDSALEGDREFITQRQSISIDILVYDNHVELAKSLKIGSYIIIQNVHAKLHSAANGNQGADTYVEFHLHGGTGYGRGISVPPEEDSDVKELQKFLDAVDLKPNQPAFDVTTSDNQLGQMSPPFDALERCQQLSVTVLPAYQQWWITPLANITKSKAPQKFRIRARLKSFQPDHLYQSLKLHCAKCNSLLDAPDEHSLKNIFEDRFNGSPNTNPPSTLWYQSALWKTETLDNRAVAIHFVKKSDMLQNPEDSLILIEGGSFKELCMLSSKFNTIILVKSKEEHLEVDLSAPFLIQGNKWLYGCITCSNIRPLDELKFLSLEGGWDAKEIAKALGIQVLSHFFVMNLTLEDETGSLNAYLWRHAEQFFHIPPSEILMDGHLQEKLHNIMSVLCPSTKQISEYPWMDCCIKSYNSYNGGREQTRYEIFDTLLSESNMDRAV